MANLDQIVGFLHKVPLFTSLKRGQLERLAKRFVERQYDAGKDIVTQGQGGEGLFIVVSGGADVFRARADGEKVLVNRFGPTDFFGEMALLDEGIRTATVVPTEKTVCLVLTRWDFLAILNEDAEISIVILQELARRFRMALEAM
jgi:CRP-like cAMP-binding protein